MSYLGRHRILELFVDGSCPCLYLSRGPPVLGPSDVLVRDGRGPPPRRQADKNTTFWKIFGQKSRDSTLDWRVYSVGVLEVGGVDLLVLKSPFSLRLMGLWARVVLRSKVVWCQ